MLRPSAPLAPWPASAPSLCRPAWPVHASHTARLLSRHLGSPARPYHCSTQRPGAWLKEEAHLGCGVVAKGISGVGGPEVISIADNRFFFGFLSCFVPIISSPLAGPLPTPRHPSSPQAWTLAGPPGTMGWWTECTGSVAGLAPHTAGPCRWINMDGRYPFPEDLGGSLGPCY